MLARGQLRPFWHLLQGQKTPRCVSFSCCMSSSSDVSLAAVNVGGGEIVLILVLFFILAVLAVGFLGLIYLIIRAVLNRPHPVLSTLPPEVALQNEQKRDREHLRLLAIFHFVFAGLGLVG